MFTFDETIDIMVLSNLMLDLNLIEEIIMELSTSKLTTLREFLLEEFDLKGEFAHVEIKNGKLFAIVLEDDKGIQEKGLIVHLASMDEDGEICLNDYPNLPETLEGVKVFLNNLDAEDGEIYINYF